MGKFGESTNFQFDMHKEHIDLTKHLRKTMYYGKMPRTERTSLPFTDMAVEFFEKMSPYKLGKIDMYYAANMSRNCCISPCSMVLALVYLKRLRNKNPDYLLQVSSSDLFLISVMIASKFMNDEGESDEVFNDEWANTANLDVSELNQLEREFLSAIEWEVFCDSSTFMDMLRKVESRIAIQEGLKRGWLSYTDVGVLFNCQVQRKTVDALVDKLIKISVYCFAAYTVSLFTLAVSFHATLQLVSLLPSILSSTANMATLLVPTVNVLRNRVHETFIINDTVPQTKEPTTCLVQEEVILALLEEESLPNISSEGVLRSCYGSCGMEERTSRPTSNNEQLLMYYNRPHYRYHVWTPPPDKYDRDRNWTLHPLFVR